MANRKSGGNTVPSSGSGGNANGAQTKSQKRRARRQRAGNDGGGPPSAVGAGHIAQGPAIIGGSRGTVRFSNREYVADVTAGQPGTAGPVVTLALNPANPSAFPWLSRIAVGYELYRFRRLVVHYTPTCGSSTAGMIVGAFDYDATDVSPANKQVLSGYDGAARGNVWNKLDMRCKPMSGWYYTGTPGSTVSNPVGTDLKMYDLGKFYLGVYNQATATTVGELTVEYEVEFAKPDTSVLTSLSEKIVTTGSALADLAAGAVTTGNNVFTIASTGSRQFTMTAQTGGDFLLEFVYQMTSTDGSYVASALQYDPNASTSSTMATVDALGTYSSPGASYSAIFMYAVTVLPGTQLVITLASGLTLGALLKARIASYRKLLA